MSYKMPLVKRSRWVQQKAPSLEFSVVSALIQKPRGTNPEGGGISTHVLRDYRIPLNFPVCGHIGEKDSGGTNDKCNRTMEHMLRGH
jgi:hypothetical protein